jgi:hypothetical protein
VSSFRTRLLRHLRQHRVCARIPQERARKCGPPLQVLQERHLLSVQVQHTVQGHLQPTQPRPFRPHDRAAGGHADTAAYELADGISYAVPYAVPYASLCTGNILLKRSRWYTWSTANKSGSELHGLPAWYQEYNVQCAVLHDMHQRTICILTSDAVHHLRGRQVPRQHRRLV